MTENRSNSSRFVSTYNQLDEYMRDQLGNDKRNTTYYHRVHGMASKEATFRKYKLLLHSFGELRNAIVHDYGRNEMEIIAEPHLDHVETYERILADVMNPAMALDTIAVKVKELYTLKPEYDVLKAIQIMSKENYSYAPLLDNDQIIGVFSEESLFDYLNDFGKMDLTNGLKLKDLKKYTTVNDHRSEAFQFASEKETVADLEERLRGIKDQHRRFEVVFITKNGKLNENLLGMVTIWDLAQSMI